MFTIHNLRLFIAGAVGTLVVLGIAPVSASSANISHSYHADSTITNGSIVSLDPQRSGYVQPSNVNNGSRLLGVAVAANDSLVAVDPTAGMVQVATSGSANTLVSTIDGNIQVGDQVAVSPFNGIGMKALAGSHVIGLAQTAFSSSSSGASSHQVTDKNGKTSSVEVGYVRLNVAVGTDATGSGDNALSTLQKLAKALTGHTVSVTRVLLSMVVAGLAMLSLIVLIYASIYGSIISIGRNPLAKFSVFRALGSVLGLAVLTAAFATLTIFFLLR